MMRVSVTIGEVSEVLGSTIVDLLRRKQVCGRGGEYSTEQVQRISFESDIVRSQAHGC